METEIRYRLSALEERSRDTFALSLAIKATLAALPEIANADRIRALESLKNLVKDLPDAVAVQLKATRHVDDILSNVPAQCRI